MFINGMGQYFGLLSGGCLEADIVLNARKVIEKNLTLTVVYDSNDEDDITFKFGLGCGGKIYIMLQPITNENDLCLTEIFNAIKNRQAGIYHQKISDTKTFFYTEKEDFNFRNKIEKRDDGEWLLSKVCPEPHILIFGGGVDSRPVVRIAKELGWLVTIVDPRVAKARRENFPTVDFILRKIDDEISEHISFYKVDAALIMSHSLKIDALSLSKLQSNSLDYVGLLGPKHRLEVVLEMASIKESELTNKVFSPAGFDIGGELPESIALSILAQCHAVLNQKSNKPKIKQANLF